MPAANLHSGDPGLVVRVLHATYMQHTFNTPNQRDIGHARLVQLRGGAEEKHKHSTSKIATVLTDPSVQCMCSSRHVSLRCDELDRLSPLTFAISTAFDSLW